MARARWKCALLAAVMLCLTASVEAATIYVPAGGDLQAALNSAQPGDTVVLEANAEFVGNFVLPTKTGDAWITVRPATPDSELPPEGVRIQPANAARLARVRSPNGLPALRTAPGAHHWILRYLEFPATQDGRGDIIQLGDGSSAQNTLARVPHHIVLRHVYVHGDPTVGQKRGIALNAAHVTIADSFISECKGVGQDTQAIGGWNGPGPYTIENNYLEAAGENVMFGGADPAIANQVPDGITFRRNYLSRPMSWRNPLLAVPTSLTVSTVAGGSLPAGSYGYRVIARRPVQGTTARSAASAEVLVKTTAVGAVRLRWQAVAGATEYRVYGRTPGGQQIFWTVTGTEFTDTGAAGTSEAVPTSAGTLWTVKNVFELKNARNVIIEENIFENHWKESQAGYAIVFTPRNSQGACTWCVVENVRFERNIVRNVAAGVNILGYDGGNPTRQTNNIVIRQNLFTALSTALGGNGRFIVIGDAPRDIVIEHNTVDSNGDTVLFAYGGPATDLREIYGFRFNSNAARHSTYGIYGQYVKTGNPVLNGYFPGHEFETNYLAGGSLSNLPTGTLLTNAFEDQFSGSAAGDYTVRDGSILDNAAPDGSDIGAHFAALKVVRDDVQAGTTAPPMGASVPAANQPPVADAGGPYTSMAGALMSADGTASRDPDGAVLDYVWSWGDEILVRASDLPADAIHGSEWVRSDVGDAAGDVMLLNPDKGAAKRGAALASPASYVEFTVNVAAGVPYRLWLRARASDDVYTNDSLYLQFSGAINTAGAPIARIGTTGALTLILEQQSGVGVAGWGWTDAAYGAAAPPVFFAQAGPQTIRIQQREDGIGWDQLILSSAAYPTAPGSAKRDMTIVDETFGTSSGVSAAHRYQRPGTYPIVLTVADAKGASASSMNIVTVK